MASFTEMTGRVISHEDAAARGTESYTSVVRSPDCLKGGRLYCGRRIAMKVYKHLGQNFFRKERYGDIIGNSGWKLNSLDRDLNDR
jgi:hypothetical protein